MVEDLELKLERHKYYTTNLETLMRLLYNDKLSADKINDVRDHVEYYVDNNDEGKQKNLNNFFDNFCDFLTFWYFHDFLYFRDFLTFFVIFAIF